VQTDIAAVVTRLFGDSTILIAVFPLLIPVITHSQTKPHAVV